MLPLLLAALAVLWLLPRRGSEWARFEEVDGVDVPDLDRAPLDEVDGFVGEVTLEDGATLFVRITPYLLSKERADFQQDAIRRVFELDEGSLWRAELRLEGGADEGATPEPRAIPLRAGEVLDEEGSALRLLVEVAGKPDSAVPLAGLFTPPPELRAGAPSVQLALWGREPGASRRLVLANGAIEVALEPGVVATEEIPRSFAYLAPTTEEVSGETREEVAAAPEMDTRDERIEELEHMLASERDARRARELAWYEYNRVLANLDVEHLVGSFAVDEELLPDGLLEAELDEQEPDPEDEEAAARARRANSILTRLRWLLHSEEYFGLDLLEVGTVQTGGVGPAIFRTLDDRGRLTGSLHADLLRLEGSRAARTLTMILDGGYESRGGVRTPFDGGARRIVFPLVDPEPWMGELPELFTSSDLFPDFNDGLWNVEAVRRELNHLLGLDVSAGLYRIHGIGGIMGDRYVNVMIEHRGTDGFVEERFFVDRMQVLLEPPGLLLVLVGGAIDRNGEKKAFLEGRHRIFLPRAPLEEWREAELPGLVDPPVPRGAADDDEG